MQISCAMKETRENEEYCKYYYFISRRISQKGKKVLPDVECPAHGFKDHYCAADDWRLARFPHELQAMYGWSKLNIIAELYTREVNTKKLAFKAATKIAQMIWFG
ncbi:MAG: hypothetical protein C4617_01685 [Candidatus Liberibacter europaeus]|uniref:Uncharacterized protein n=1 Tax=Candidatus Liberibacter europaeus TaxID=744859 RepID=A0A2T4VXQ6_9HYPH|nr:hypothetical protein [Candidatus Liberibacter europaeus]PTL86557.1 MAG: hypothetical protein C4617_01685 [Candidatus Liberibacter europaeus]